HPAKPAHPHHSAGLDFNRNPMIVYWETTQACALACQHCRAEAVTTAPPGELTTAEGKLLLRQIASFGSPLPHLILTGGDPLRRADLYELIDDARTLGIDVAITPSATPDLTYERMTGLKSHGIETVGLSLDGPNAARHDGIRGVTGTFERTMNALEWTTRLGLSVQVNTLVAQETADDLPAVYELLKTRAAQTVVRWSLFYLISVGRGRMLQPVTPERGEQIMNWACDLAPAAPFAIATTEAPSFRRVALSRMRKDGIASAEMHSSSMSRRAGVRDGQGILFVSSLGDVFPAGFLPLSAGNVRTGSVVDIYRDSALFRALRTPGEFKGRCGQCEYRELCGGSRARAFAYTGDPLETDPLCTYIPKSRMGA
ncbi:MAG: TIGR04053 family radical SAM/SPASM domain-containing protein, partial [Acidobacteriaceae bacterium]|nr:TIGR04053 family radical SAM/SPASM domain-containing protein [Acidobacteriaceae bacterium]